MAGVVDVVEPGADAGFWLPAAAWAAFLGLALAATSLGAGVYTTAVLALAPFGVAGAFTHRTRLAVAFTAFLCLALLALLPEALRAAGLKAGVAVGATAVACLALPMGSGIGSIVRHRAARAGAATPATTTPRTKAGSAAKAAPGPMAPAHATAESAAAAARPAARRRGRAAPPYP